MFMRVMWCGTLFPGLTPLAGLLGDTVAWVRVSPLAGLLGDTIAWVRVSPLAGLLRDTVAWVRILAKLLDGTL